MDDEDKATSSLRKSVTVGVNAHGNVIAGRDLTVNINSCESTTVKLITHFKQFDPPTKNFTGRRQFLEEIHNRMLKCSTQEDCLDRIVVLSGLGGIGKSELARMYAKTYINEPIIQNVAWIDAEEERGMKASFVSLAKSLNVLTDNKDLEGIIEEVYAHFLSHIQNGLLIFDNSKQMNDSPFGIYQYLPIQESIQHKPLILVTARDQDWDVQNDSNVININELSQQESVELLEKKFCLTRENKNYKDYKKLLLKLANSLQGYPLGLALATANIRSSKNWNELKIEIESYLERMGEPGGDWIEDDQPQAATRYKLIMENVWKVTLEKIKASKASGENAIRLLNILAYFPSHQIQQIQIKNIFNDIYSTELLPRVFHLLENYSLIKIETHKTDYGKKMHIIRIHRLVQLATRNKLDRENDLSYLFRLCEYFTYMRYSSSCLHTDAMMGLHDYLRDRKWPEKSIQSSLIFCSSMTSYIANVKFAVNLAQDVYIFLNLDEPESAKAEHGDDVVNLFYLCMFWINQNIENNEMADLFLVTNKQLENVFISMVQPSTKFALTSSGEPKSIREHSYSLYLRLLPTFIELRKESTRQLIPMIIPVLNETCGSNVKYISTIFKTVWTFLKCDVLESVALLAPLFQKHFELYDGLSTFCEFNEYWESGDTILDIGFLEQQLNDEDNREINNGKLGRFKATKAVIRSLALYLSAREELVKSAEFIVTFSKFTEMILGANYGVLDKFRCIMCWFSLYSSQKPDKGVSNISIHTIAPVLHEVLNNFKQVHDEQEYMGDNFDSEFVIQTFLETFKDEPDCLAFRTACRILIKDKAYAQSEEFAREIKMLELEDKMQLIQRTHENAAKLLNVLAYLKCNTPKATTEAIFKFIFNYEIPQDAFTSLAEHSLLPLFLEEERHYAERWQVINPVKILIQEKLLNKNDHVCLLGVSHFGILQTLEDSDYSGWDFSSLHQYLKDFEWPQNSAYISMIFSVFLTESSFDFNNKALDVLEETTEFCRLRWNTNSTILNWHETPYFQIFYLCLYWVDFKLGQSFDSHKVWEDLNLSKAILADTFLESIRPSVEHFLQPQTNLSLIQELNLGISLYVLKLLLKVLVKLETEMKTKIDSLILEFVNATNGCVTKNISGLFELLWGFYKHACDADSLKYLATIFRKHFQVNDFFVPSPKIRFYTDWDDCGPLNLEHVMRVCSKSSDAHKLDIAACFFNNHGLSVVIHHFTYSDENRAGINFKDLYLLGFIQMIAYDLHFAANFMSLEFLDKLNKFTQRALKGYGSIKFRCALLWFALFARPGAKVYKKECNFLFDVVALQLETLISHIKLQNLAPQVLEEEFLATKGVLQIFLETFSDKSDEICFKAAAEFLDLVQSEMAPLSVHNLDRKKRKLE